MVTIKEWTTNKTILITGGAGFFGKVLTEKLLRTCPGVKRIYLIIRSKRGQSPQERWSDIVKDPLFEKLLAETPDIIDKKVTILDGDMSLIDLGLSEETMEELENSVNIIFHAAATVRFNDPLRKALLSNTRGTLEMCKLASKTNNLEVFVHVSTTFCNHNLNKTIWEEKIYEPYQDWRTMLKLIEDENPTVMNTLCNKIIGDHPNTYTFSKSLSEKIVEEYSYRFPTVIARSPIVAGILQDPVSGWTDNLNGLLGLSTAFRKGVMRVLISRKECVLDCIPVDVAINALIICGWDKATSENKDISIYNCSHPECFAISIEELTKIGEEVDEKESILENDIWYPFLIYTRNNSYFHFLFYMLQVIPAALIDTILLLMNKKRRLMKITIKLYLAEQALIPFTTKEIKSDNKKYKALWNKMRDDEAKIFLVNYDESSGTDMTKTVKIMLKGIKKFVLKEKLEDSEYHKQKLKRLYYLDRSVRGILIAAALVKLYNFIMQYYTDMYLTGCD